MHCSSSICKIQPTKCVNRTVMATHSVYYPSSSEVVTPWNAKYTYPSQANKSRKFTPRIPPKNGAIFNPGNIIRLEFPAQGYVNPLNTTIEFDVVLYGPVNTSAYQVRFQNNIQSIFNRVRLLYGSDVSEDLQRYNVLVRALTEWTSTNQSAVLDQTSISEGIGGYTTDFALSYNVAALQVTPGLLNTRQSKIQGISKNYASAVHVPFTTTGSWTASSGTGYSSIPNDGNTVSLPSGSPPIPSGGITSVRRYQINLALGVFTQDKLIPVRYMASQLVIEITLENAAACIYQPVGQATNTVQPNYCVGNVNLIPEILEFDDTYDSAFLDGLEAGGVPIKFSTWNYFPYTTQGAGQVNYQVNERSRSVKGLFVVQRRGTDNFAVDNGACFFDTQDNGGTPMTTKGSTMQEFQFRIGGIYYPGVPVQTATNNGSSFTNGGCEAYVELTKFLNIVGDYRLQTNASVKNWAVPSAITVASNCFPEFDYTNSICGTTAYGIPILQAIESNTCVLSGTQPSCCFAACTNFETSNGMEISGLNAEEQSDISVNIKWSGSQTLGFWVEVFTYVDRMWVLRPNNYMDLIR